MITKMQSTHIDEVMKIWLGENLSSHSYISPNYWYSNYNEVKNAILKSEVYVYIDENIVKGFIGIENSYIAGLFVKNEFQGLGIGTKLLHKCKEKYQNLYLKVFSKNVKAINFYTKNSFIIKEEKIDEDTKETEYFMQYVAPTKF